MKLTKKEKDQVKKVVDGEKDLFSDYPELYGKLYDHYVHEMPYGVAKARTGDPDDWLLHNVLEGLEL